MNTCSNAATFDLFSYRRLLPHFYCRSSICVSIWLNYACFLLLSICFGFLHESRDMIVNSFGVQYH